MAAGHRSNGAPAEEDAPDSGSIMQYSSRNAVELAHAARAEGASGSATRNLLHQL